MELGYNGANLFSIFNNGVVSQSFYNKIAKDKRAKLVRFPGGTLAEKYLMAGYGYGDGTPTKAKRNFLDAFIDFSKQNNSKAILVFRCLADVASKRMEYVNQNLRMMRAVLDAGISIEFIELGNELYLYDVVTGSRNGDIVNVPKITTSLNHYRKLYDMYRANVPENIPLSLVADNELHNRGRFWNLAIRSIGAKDVSLHWYFDKVTSVADMDTQVARITKNFAGVNTHVTEWNMHCGHNTKLADYPNNDLVDGPIHKMILDNGDAIFEKYGVKTSILHLMASERNHPQAAYRNVI